MTIKDVWSTTMRSQWMDDCPPQCDVDLPDDGCKRQIGARIVLAGFLVACLGLTVILATLF